MIAEGLKLGADTAKRARLVVVSSTSLFHQFSSFLVGIVALCVVSRLRLCRGIVIDQAARVDLDVRVRAPSFIPSQLAEAQRFYPRPLDRLHYHCTTEDEKRLTIP